MYVKTMNEEKNNYLKFILKDLDTIWCVESAAFRFR